MYGRVKPEPGYMHQVIGHDIAPADLVVKLGDLRKSAFLAAFVLVVVVLASVLFYPGFPLVHFFRCRKNDLKKSLFLNRLQVVINIMVEFMAVTDNLRCDHIVLIMSYPNKEDQQPFLNSC